MNKLFYSLALLAASCLGALAQDPCERFPQGSTVHDPVDLYSKDGVLAVDLDLSDPAG